MAVNETISLIRDIAVIAAAVVFTIVLLVGGFVLLKLYPVVRRAAVNVEQTSSLVYNVVSQPFHLVSEVVELFNRILAMVSQGRKGRRREEDAEE